MVRGIIGRECHVSLQSQNPLCLADVEGTLSPAPLASLRLHAAARVRVLGERTVWPAPGRGTHGAQRTSGRQRVRGEKAGLQKAAEQRGGLMKVTKSDNLPSSELFI